MEAFAGFFLAMMGREFLVEYYRISLEGDDGINVLALDDDGLVGFVSGSVDPIGLYSRISQSKMRLVGPVLRALARRPSLLFRVAHNAMNVRKQKSHDTRFADGDAELTSIAVSPSKGGRGIGGVLVDAFVAEARSRGACRVLLSTDADDNDPVNAFYVKKGFRLRDSRHVSGGRRMNVYEIRL